MEQGNQRPKRGADSFRFESVEQMKEENRLLLIERALSFFKYTWNGTLGNTKLEVLLREDEITKEIEKVR